MQPWFSKQEPSPKISAVKPPYAQGAASAAPGALARTVAKSRDSAACDSSGGTWGYTIETLNMKLLWC